MYVSTAAGIYVRAQKIILRPLRPLLFASVLRCTLYGVARPSATAFDRRHAWSAWRSPSSARAAIFAGVSSFNEIPPQADYKTTLPLKTRSAPIFAPPRAAIEGDTAHPPTALADD